MSTSGFKETTPAQKYPSEKLIRSFDFSEWLPANVTISSATVTVEDSEGNDVTATMISGSDTVSGANVYYTIQGGVAGQNYVVICKAIFSNAEEQEARLPFSVL